MGDARLRCPLSVKLSLKLEGKIRFVENVHRQPFSQRLYFSLLFCPSFYSYVATHKNLLFEPVISFFGLEKYIVFSDG